MNEGGWVHFFDEAEASALDDDHDSTSVIKKRTLSAGCHVKR